MRSIFPGSILRLLPALALLLISAAGNPLPAAQEPVRQGNTPVILFDPAQESPTMTGEPDSVSLLQLISEKLRAALSEAGYSPVTFNPESPTIRRAVERDRTLREEDLMHPESEAAARRIAALHGARFVLFPRLVDSVLDKEGAQARLGIALRVVPELGAEQQIRGNGTVQLKPDARDRKLADRLLQQAADAAARDAVRQLGASSNGAETPQTTSAAQSYYTQAVENLKKERFDLAEPLLERATLLDPQNVDYAGALGDLYLRKGQVANALMEYRRAVTLQPASVDLRVRLSKAYLQRNMPQEAAAELRRAAQVAPEDAGVRAALLELYLRGNMVKEAVAEYRHMAEARPKDASIRLDLGDLLVRQGLLEDAQEEYKHAATMEPQNHLPHEKLADLYRKREMPREALKELILAQRTATGTDDGQRYRAIATALDAEATRQLTEAKKASGDREANKLTNEEAYTTVKALAAGADALTAEATDLQAPGTLAESHRRRIFAYSLLTQSLLAYLSYYENDRLEEGANAALLYGQAEKELQRAQDALKLPEAASKK